MTTASNSPAISRIHGRRRFLGTAAAASLGFWGCRPPAKAQTSIVILHTNDTHAHLEPFPDNHPTYPGLGGAARRAAMVARIRAAHEHVLLLDSGDIFSGTAYFNLFGGEADFKAMSAMGYDVATLGNHDFDAGVDGLVKQMPHADFEFVSANYDVGESALAPHVEPYTIRELGGVKVGIFGLGIQLDGLVLSDLHRGVHYQDPIHAARQTTATLRQAGCQLVVCLSHLGHRYRTDRVSDLDLAALVPEIDLILGGHTHTLLETPEIIKGTSGQQTMIQQVGWAGIHLGRVDVHFSADRRPLTTVAGRYRMEPRSSTGAWRPCVC